MILLNYYSVSLSEYVSSTVFGSVVALCVLVLALGVALIALGVFISSLTDNQGFAAGIGIAVILRYN